MFLFTIFIELWLSTFKYGCVYSWLYTYKSTNTLYIYTYIQISVAGIWRRPETTNCYTMSCTSGHSLQISNKTFRMFKCNIHESANNSNLAPAFPDKENRERTSTNLKQTIGHPHLRGRQHRLRFIHHIQSSSLQKSNQIWKLRSI